MSDYKSHGGQPIEFCGDQEGWIAVGSISDDSPDSPCFPRVALLGVGLGPSGKEHPSNIAAMLTSAQTADLIARLTAAMNVDRPAPRVDAQPPPVLDLDALAEDVAHLAKLDLVGELRSLVSAAPHLIAEARAAVALRAEVAAYSRLATDVTLAINAALGNDARLGAEIHHEVTRIVGALRQELARLLDLDPDRLNSKLGVTEEERDAARQEVARLTAELAAAETLVASYESPTCDHRHPCRCGSGGHPRRCERHPNAYDRHIVELNAIGKTEAEREAVEVRICTIADEAFGPFPVQSTEESLTAIEHGIASLRRELAAARAVPAEVDAAIEAHGLAAFEAGVPSPTLDAASAHLKAAIARAISDATAGAVAYFIDGHAKRLCELVGGVWADESDSWASQVHDVLNHLRGSEDGTVIDARASQPATVGGLLATHLKAIRSRSVVIECFDSELFSQISYEESVHDELRGGEHHQTICNYYAERTFDGGWSDADPIWDIDTLADQLNCRARLVSAGDDENCVRACDADPASRGPIGEG